ncbi:hypothetical protein B0J12DRAFT_680931 [Macrophomina phaseolina]|uniref:Uncharacterized protein n=1 Tax=Macrophomina phaseolina TaxID=35725 RepID=A0ABQ8FWM9_9PEZI|nr:hypothetical protein B0J12DRAFT_680931 [Macrophomina phaseolina]
MLMGEGTVIEALSLGFLLLAGRETRLGWLLWCQAWCLWSGLTPFTRAFSEPSSLPAAHGVGHAAGDRRFRYIS